MLSEILWECVEPYLAELAASGRSAGYIASIRTSLRAYTKINGVLDTPTALTFLRENYTTKSTFNKVRNHLIGFAKYLADNKHPQVSRLKIPDAKLDERLPEVVDITEVNKVIDYCQQHRHRKMKQVGLFLLILRDTGMRFNEAYTLNGSDVKHNVYGTYLEVIGKGNKQRVVPLTDECHDAIKRWVVTKRLPVNTFRNWLKRAIAGAGVRHIRPKDLRSTFATDAVNGGASYDVLADWLGHSDVRITRQYYARRNTRNLTQVLKHVKAVRSETQTERLAEE